MPSLEEQLVKHEGLVLRPYIDTVGKWTIGVGRNLTDVGLTEDEALTLLRHDIERTTADLRRALPWFDRLDPIRQRVLIDMGFNLGVAGLLGFQRMLGAVQVEQWDEAADHMRHSKWAGQVGRRAERLARMIQTGEDYVS